MPLPTLLVKGKLFTNGQSVDEIPINYLKQWITTKMPEFGYKEEITTSTRCLVVISETGSGKSTTLPTELMRIFRGKKFDPNAKYTGRSVICLQPKVLTTISIANDICDENWAPDNILGKTVGYMTGSATTVMPKGGHGLLYSTYGAFYAVLTTKTDEEIMNEYAIIIYDEAHSREIDNDIILMMLKNFYIRNKGNKKLPFLILTSATINADKYTAYLGLTDDNVLTVRGSAYEKTEHWPIISCPNYLNFAIEKTIELVKEDLEGIKNGNPIDEPGKGDILIFVTGVAEIKYIHKNLEAFAGENAIMLIKLDGVAVQDNTKDYSFLEIPHDQLEGVYKRVIISTTVSETGLTIPSVKYVIEGGWNKTVECYFPPAAGLISKPAPQSRVIQRMGRCGRLFPGEFYPTYPRIVFDALPKQQLPHIYIENFANVYLFIVKHRFNKTKGSFYYDEIDLLDYPDAKVFINANVMAHELGFLKTNVAKNICTFTALGEKMLPTISRTTTMELLRCVACAKYYGCEVDDIIIIHAIIQDRVAIGDLFINKKRIPTVTVKFTELFMTEHYPELSTEIDIDDDIIIMWKILTTVLNKMEDFDSVVALCEKHNLVFDRIMALITVKCELSVQFLTNGINTVRTGESKISDIKKCIADGYRFNILTRNSSGGYSNRRYGIDVGINCVNDKQYRCVVGPMPTISVNNEEGGYKLTMVAKMILDGVEGYSGGGEGTRSSESSGGSESSESSESDEDSDEGGVGGERDE